MADDNIIVEDDAADTFSALTALTSFITMTIIKAGLLRLSWAQRALGTKLKRNLINSTLIAQLTVACSFFENAIPFNVAFSSSFADMISESMSFRQHNYLESYKIPGSKKLATARYFQAARNY